MQYKIEEPLKFSFYWLKFYISTKCFKLEGAQRNNTANTALPLQGVCSYWDMTRRQGQVTLW